ncbi:hypothetical protein Tco_1359933 [Tanacetum coccineum]
MGSKTQKNGYTKDPIGNVFIVLVLLLQIVQLILFLVESRLHQAFDGAIVSLLFDSRETFTIKGFYYVEGLTFTIFHSWSFCDVDLETHFFKLQPCLMAKDPNSSMVMARRLSSSQFDYINAFIKRDIVIGLPKLKYVRDYLCFLCEVVKQKEGSLKSKIILDTLSTFNDETPEVFKDFSDDPTKSSSPVISVAPGQRH